MFPVMPGLTKVCPKCSTQTETEGDYCPHCGASYLGKKRFRWSRLSKRARITIAAGFILLLVVTAGAATALKIKHDRDVRAKNAKVAAAKKKQRERAALQATLLKLERNLRRSVVRDLESSVTKDARSKVADGLLDGPILSTSCQAKDTSYLDSPDTTPTEDFECIAVNKNLSNGQASGYRFSATANFKKSSYTWHLGG
jgi:RNA polymerase subunit RPABC4/transcription elongation factor Spt4